ncbi:ABC transporter ATP-binding protein [Phytobacter sp. V91]|uniref:ABC transporter ATP-binding protein n=1 Tax=Phytobacter sp. V91 TaxID=3369425 RepID=UPI003F602DBE
MKTTTGYGITLNKVSKRFDHAAIINDVDLMLRAGEFVAVVGRSGCGKSTLLRMIAGLDTPTAGTVAIEGQPVVGINPQVRVLFQEARLLPWRSVLENVCLGTPQGDNNIALNALRQVGLGDKATQWPGLLSGGQKQRVALARALVAEPRVLLLDEPLGALDALTRIEMQELIERIWREQGFTAVLVTHDVDEAVRLADRVIVMDQQRIALDIRIPLARPHASEADLHYYQQIILGKILHPSPRVEDQSGEFTI